MNRNQQTSGMTVVFALTIAVVLGLTVLSVAKMVNHNAHQVVYFNSMGSATRIAEKGLSVAIAELAKSPNVTAVPAEVDASEMGGKAFVEAFIRDKPLPNIYYIVSRGEKYVRDRKYTSTLHSYARVSNVGEYFAAVKEDLSIARGTDLSMAKIYAPKLYFLDEPTTAGVTQVGCAEFVNLVSPLIDQHNLADPADDTWDGAAPAFLNINPACHPNQVPVKLNVGLLFPEVLDSDMEYYKDKATAANINRKCTFVDTIFPPGYDGAPTAPDIDGNFDPENEEHVWYCDGDVSLRGEIHGQVLIVSKGNIHITGDIFPSPLGIFPGGVTGKVPSKAHQLVLITKKTVFIDNNTTIFDGSSWIKIDTAVKAVNRTLRIEATLVMAPDGSIQPEEYLDPLIQDQLSVRYSGSMILRRISDAPNSFPNVFRKDRAYAYDDSFKTTPPPYLPAVAEIYYSWEEPGIDGSGLYN